jgi:hypothetical protein
MFTRTALLLLSTLLAAGGCAGDRTFEPDSVTDGVSSGDLDGAEEGAEEGAVDDGDSDPTFDPQSDEPPPEALLACDLEMACEHPMELVRSEAATAYETSDECALKSLAGGSHELVQTVAVFPDAEAYLDHVIDADGIVLRQAHGRSDDLGLWQKPVERCTLSDPKFFAACLEQFDAGCLDPDRWIVPGSCEPLGSLTCPQP